VKKTHGKSKLQGLFSVKENNPLFRKGKKKGQKKIVDDFATMRKIFRNILKQIGFEDISEAEDGNDALRVLKDEAVGLVITDWNMPNMSGLDLLREIRKNPQTAKLPVLMVTAEGLKENVIEAVKAGVNNYVVKPFTAEVIQEKIVSIFKKQAGA
jgi:two-component system chemotaxis response regulator CheY